MSTPQQPASATTVTQVEVEDLTQILSMPGAENVMVPSNGKPGFFQTKKVDPVKFLDTPDDPDPTDPPVEDPPPTDSDPIDPLLADPNPLDPPVDPASANPIVPKAGRKSGLVELFSTAIEKGVLVGFEEDKSLDKYTVNDFQELLEANIKHKEESLQKQLQKDFFNSLPEEVRIPYQYARNGGDDFKGLYRALSQVEESIDLNPDNESHQELIVRNYLQATKFGTDDEITEEITSWKDRGDLPAKAKKFKPKLDNMTQQIVAAKLERQNQMRQQQVDAANDYTDSVYETLKPGDLNGIKLDKRVQNTLYAGLTQPNYPSITGKMTNLFGHLIEKYQFVEPNHALIAEALWLLSNPEDYRKKIMEQGSKKTVQNTVRTLKTEQTRSLNGGTVDDDPDDISRKKGLKRNQDTFFKRD